MYVLLSDLGGNSILEPMIVISCETKERNLCPSVQDQQRFHDLYRSKEGKTYMIVIGVGVDGSINILMRFIGAFANRREISRFSPVTPGDELDVIR